MNKQSLSERDICTKFITPAIKQAVTMGGIVRDAGLTIEEFRKLL
jgi:hypothetical protein